MTILGNAILFLATLFFIGLLSIIVKEPPRNDGAVGYFWTLFILNGLFIVSMIIVALIIGAKGGFAWVSPNGSTRFLVVTITLLTALITAALAGIFRYEPGPVPSLLRAYAYFAPILIPVVLIGASIVLLNGGLRESVPVGVYKWPLALVAVLGITGCAAAVMGYFSEVTRNRTAEMEDTVRRNNENHNRILADIDSFDVMTHMGSIIGFTDGNQDQEIRDKALAKMKTHPEWEQEVIRLLDTDTAPEVFHFVAYNDVENPAMFAEPIRQGIFKQAHLFRERIRRSSHPSHFYPELFLFEVERILKTVERYKGQGVDYVPAIQELRASMDEPTEFEKPVFRSAELLDKWIQKNMK